MAGKIPKSLSIPMILAMPDKSSCVHVKRRFASLDMFNSTLDPINPRVAPVDPEAPLKDTFPGARRVLLHVLLLKSCLGKGLCIGFACLLAESHGFMTVHVNLARSLSSGRLRYIDAAEVKLSVLTFWLFW